MCAALDRQHPRDLYDIAQLLDHEGFERALMKTFLVYLISHRRPMAELLSPRRKDLLVPYRREFQVMMREPVTVEALVEARERLVASIHSALTERDKSFLLSVKSRTPDW